jgi:ribosomal protein S18 acetylase RimI-like enzyme
MYQVRETADEDELLPLLAADRAWCAYALCDLDPRHSSGARFIVALDGSRPCALALLYTLPGTVVLFLHGHGAATEAIFETLADLPSEVMLSVRLSDLPAVGRRYDLRRWWTMRRMAMAPDALTAPRHVEAHLGPLSTAHAAVVRRLFSERSDTVYYDGMLADDTYVGAWIGENLVAIAGTHIVSWRYSIAAVGNVYTRPEYRGQGLAQATTHAVVSGLGRRGVRDVVLNVNEQNNPALAAYRRLGFQDRGPFAEGTAWLR